MADPVKSHVEDIHITAASGTTLSNANKLEETSKVSISESTTTVDRQLLCSDGWTKTSATFQTASGSMDGWVVRSSAVQEAMKTARRSGAYAYLHIITNPAGDAGEKGERYEIVFESYEEGREAGNLVSFTASFKVNGAPVAI